MAPVGDMFWRRIDKLFSGLPNVFGIGNDILFAHFDEQGKDHDATLDIVRRVCRQVNLKLNKDKCLSDAPAFHSLVK